MRRIVRVGYIIASKHVSEQRMRVGWLYREEPDDEGDSGWRVFSGYEDQAYVDTASNLALFNASTILEIDPSIRALLGSPVGSAFERDEASGEFRQVE